MLFERLLEPSHRILLIGLGLAWLSTPLMAETDAEKSGKKPDVLMAELAEDESVEDVEQSAPLETAAPGKEAVNPGSLRSGVGIDTPSSPSRKVAPNIDLKEIAPPPEAQASESTDTAPDDTGSAVVATKPEPEPAIREGEVFTLLDTDVMPGTSTRLAWTPGIQIAGLSQTTPVLVVNGINAGPTLCLTGAIHGDELNGIEIIRQTMYDLNPEKLSGRVVGVPIVNLPGFQQGSRYLPDRRDLNRHFPGSQNGTLADRIAHSLFENVIRKCDMLVDIHTGSLKRTNLPQLRADMNNPEVAEFTRGFDRMAVVHSSGSAGMLRTAAVEAGIRTVTLEAGESHRIQQHQISAGVNSLTSLMERQGMISRMFVWGDPEPVYYDSNWIRADHGGILFSDIELGATVSKGEILGYVSDPITNAQHPIRSSSDGRVIGMAVDQVVMAGFAAYHIGTEAEVPGE
ncbi:succinylglutamate desuccinylase/aspartoacylase family protein [Marinobacter sp. F3R08]|uniref:succinylglutamate desuccinylase/aspartoacylase family protein n=1 Tax=Marinobacter sp. F3R08 TaxID=2841559 RepID=UPI001C09C433|nr:succinylglutamate desuccinylase/aspartoacylase family protein [Marinobacter sp. F3R08]MBU2953037.1 succinylglutamate desuccinylase/aspartoacylase family protein [Marinobacter sp. F3R08]